MAKAQKKESRSAARASRSQPLAMPRSMQHRGSGDRRKAVQPPKRGKARGADEAEGVTRVTRETEVRGTETRVERVVERAARPTLPVDRAAGRGRYVYCIIRANSPLKFGAIGMDEQWPEVYTISFQDMAAVVSDVPMTPLD